MHRERASSELSPMSEKLFLKSAEFQLEPESHNSTVLILADL